ncbi:12151_t:CDS:2, partial [Dentiscutata erythropus]
MYPAVEKELVNYVKKKQEERIAVTTSIIGKKVKELEKALDIQGAKFSASWNKLVEQVRTQQAQKLPEDMPIVVREFLQTS